MKTVLTTADGEVRTEVGQGDYSLHVENNGYMNADVDEISIKCGYTTDAGACGGVYYFFRKYKRR